MRFICIYMNVCSHFTIICVSEGNVTSTQHMIFVLLKRGSGAKG